MMNFSVVLREDLMQILKLSLVIGLAFNKGRFLYFEYLGLQLLWGVFLKVICTH